MKKLTLLITIAVLFLTVALISCSGSSGTSTDTGYNTITWARNLMPPDVQKGYNVPLTSGTCSGSDCLSVSFSGYANSEYYTMFAIANTGRTERLILIIKNLILYDYKPTETDDPYIGPGTGLLEASPANTGPWYEISSANVVGSYVNGESAIQTAVTGTAQISITQIDKTYPDINASDHAYSLMTLTVESGSISIDGVSVTSITAMHYPFTEPDLTE